MGTDAEHSLLRGLDRCLALVANDLAVVDRLKAVWLTLLDDILSMATEPIVVIDCPLPRHGIIVGFWVFAGQHEWRYQLDEILVGIFQP